MLILKKRQILRIESVCWNSFVLGVVLQAPLVLLLALLMSGPFTTSWPTPGGTTLTILVAVISLIIGPTIALVRFRAHLSTPKRRTLASFSAAGGLLCICYAFTFIGLAFGGYPQLLAVMGLHGILSIIWLGASMALWPFVIRKFPFQTQTGDACPQCGYCVRGVTSRICPECGRGFCESDLGLSTVEFEHLVAGRIEDSGLKSAN